jgi:hypothetical protein
MGLSLVECVSADDIRRPGYFRRPWPPEKRRVRYEPDAGQLEQVLVYHKTHSGLKPRRQGDARLWERPEHFRVNGWKQHIRLDAGEWFVPADNSKNGKPNTLYLSDFAMNQFITLRKINGASQWGFPNRDNSGRVCVKTVTKQLSDRQRAEANPMSGRSSHTSALALPGEKQQV